MQQIKNIKHGRYTVKGEFTFNSNIGLIKINSGDALEIAYTLFDYACKSYDILDEISNKLEEI